MVFAWMPAIAIYFTDPDGHSLEFIAILEGKARPALGVISYDEWKSIDKKPCKYKLDTPQKSEYPALLDVWESSVRATHHFLKNNDIAVFKKIIQEKQVFNHVKLTCVRDINDTILGIMGVSEDNLEMLFIDSHFIGQGIGKLLLLHAITNLNITKVNVNEQNEQALKFYEHFGFKVTSKSELDETGKPYPILHMQLKQNLLPGRVSKGDYRLMIEIKLSDACQARTNAKPNFK